RRAVSADRRQARRLSHRAKRRAQGGPGLKRTPLAIPTTPACPNLALRAPAEIASWSQQPAAAQSQKHPRTSPPFPALVDERFHGRRIGARRRSAEKSPRRTGPAGPQHTVTNQPRQSSVLPTFLAPGDGFQSRDRTPPVDDQHRRAAPEAVDQGAQAVLGLGYAGFFHLAKIALTSTPIKTIPFLRSTPLPAGVQGRQS